MSIVELLIVRFAEKGVTILPVLKKPEASWVMELT